MKTKTSKINKFKIQVFQDFCFQKFQIFLFGNGNLCYDFSIFVQKTRKKTQNFRFFRQNKTPPFMPWSLMSLNVNKQIFYSYGRSLMLSSAHSRLKNIYVIMGIIISITFTIPGWGSFIKYVRMFQCDLNVFILKKVKKFSKQKQFF